MSLKDPEAYKEYMKKYMRERYNKQKLEKKLKENPKMSEDDFNVTEMITSSKGKESIDLKGKAVTTLLDVAKKSSKDDTTDDEDPIFKTIERIMKYAPVITELFKGFSAAAVNFKSTQAPPQQQQKQLQAPDGWESMSALQRMSKKYTRPEWYALGERYDTIKATGGSGVTAINTNYVDSTYNQPVAQREAQTLAELSRKHPELPQQVEQAQQAEHSEQAEPEQQVEQKKPEFVKQRLKKTQDTKEELELQAQTELINKMRQDNNKYITMAFNYLKGMSIEDFANNINNVESLKTKFNTMKMFLPVQTKEMLKATSYNELLETLKEKDKVKYDWLQDNKKVSELGKIFEDIKKGL